MKSRVKIEVRSEPLTLPVLFIEWEAMDGSIRGLSKPINPSMDPMDLPEFFEELGMYLEISRRDGKL